MREVWSIPVIKSGFPNKDWLEQWLLSMPMEMCNRTLMIARRIWHARDEVTHDKELPAIEGSRRFIYSYMQSLANIRSMTPEQIMKGKLVPEAEAVEVRAVQHPVHVVWQRPPAGLLKLNVDGAFIAQSGRAGTGMILRRSDGSIVFSACSDLHRCLSAPEAELQACMEGLRFALDMSQERVSLDTDSAQLVQLAFSDKGRFIRL